MVEEKTKLVIIDANSILHRAFHALPPLTSGEGEPVGAVYGFLLVFLKVIGKFHPGFLVTCFDYPAPTFRHKRFKNYKAQRPPTPRDLVAQIPKIKEILTLFSTPVLEEKGFEADDLIGTVSSSFSDMKKASAAETIIVSGDKDLLQLVDKRTRVYLLTRGVKNADLYDENLIKEKYSGLRPKQLVDLRALAGDASDNIPGVAGIGKKTALKLLVEFGSITALYKGLKKRLEEPPLTSRVKKLLLVEKERAFLSQELAQIKKDVAVSISPEESRWGEYDRQAVIDAFQKLGFKTLIKRISGEQKGLRASREKTMKLF
jgi:DNA polymerase-1